MRRVVEPYGTDPRQFGEFFLPEDPEPPLVVLIHGGYWRPVYRLDIEEPSAVALAEAGFAVWSIEYRTYESGWPSTFVDVAAAVDHGICRASELGVDTTRRAICGHSAGGALAAWVTSRRGLPTEAPGANPQAPTFDLVVLAAPVACLTLGSSEGLGKGAIDTVMGGRPEDVPERYAVCDPGLLTPDPGRRLILHGDVDIDVPLSQSECALAHLQRNAIPSDLTVITGDDHFGILDPLSPMSQLRLASLRSALHP